MMQKMQGEEVDDCIDETANDRQTGPVEYQQSCEESVSMDDFCTLSEETKGDEELFVADWMIGPPPALVRQETGRWYPQVK